MSSLKSYSFCDIPSDAEHSEFLKNLEKCGVCDWLSKSYDGFWIVDDQAVPLGRVEHTIFRLVVDLERSDHPICGKQVATIIRSVELSRDDLVDWRRFPKLMEYVVSGEVDTFNLNFICLNLSYAHSGNWRALNACLKMFDSLGDTAHTSTNKFMQAALFLLKSSMRELDLKYG